MNMQSYIHLSPWNAHGTIERDVVDHKIRIYMAHFVAILGYIYCTPVSNASVVHDSDPRRHAN